MSKKLLNFVTINIAYETKNYLYSKCFYILC
jgi:hypothetical protein